MVTDLHHLLDLPDGTPGPARRLAGHLSNIVRAATAGDAGIAWESALPCRRRPGSACDDQGIISNWAGSPCDLRPRRLTLAGPVNEIVISEEAAAALRELRLPDAGCERLVFRIRAHDGGAVLPATPGDLDELIGFVAAEANHASSRRRQQRLGAALDALSNTAPAH